MKDANVDYDRQLIRGNTEIVLLHVIGSLGSSYGYQLIKEIESRSNGFFRFKEGTVYPKLHKLEREDYIRAEWRDVERGQQRKYYTLTGKGEQALLSRLDFWQSFSEAMNLLVGKTANERT